MWRIVAAVVVLFVAVSASVYWLDRMQLIDVSGYVLERALTVPAVSDHASIYQLGLQRRQEIDALRADLTRGQLAIDEEAQALAKEWQAIEAARRALEREEERLQSEWEAIQAGWEALRAAEQEHENWDNLVRAYRRMRPADFAAIADGLTDEVLIRLLSDLTDRQAGDLLAGLPSDRAAEITLRLAEALDEVQR